MVKQTSSVKYLSDYQKPSFTIEQLAWTFDLDPTNTVVTANMDFKRTGVEKNLLLDGENLSLQWVKLNGRLLNTGEYQVNDCALLIYNVPDQFSLEMQVVINPDANKALMGLYLSKGTFCTQCEPHGFRRICYFLDRPDVLTYIRTKLIARQDLFPVLLSNGNCVGTGNLPDNKHWVEWEDPSLKPCYLFALVAGEFDLIQDSFQTMQGRLVDLRVYVDPGKREQGLFAMGALKRAMKWDEEVYGRCYDLDIYSIVAVSDFNQGAMENKGLNIFNSACVLAEPSLATDREFQYVEGVIGHEYFHNWSGNRVTVRDWFQLSLKEGLTIFRDQDFTMAMTSKTVKRIEDVSIIRNFQFPQDAGPLAHPVQPDHYISMDNFYTVTVYNKGAEVIRMIKTIIGSDAFAKGMDLYFDTHDGKAVEINDFATSMEQASGLDLTQFKRWYTQSGTPHVDVVSHWEGSTLTLTLTQTCKETPNQKMKKPFFIPFSIGILDQEGQSMTTAETQDPHHFEAGSFVLYLSEESQVFTFTGITQKPNLSLLRGFSAPVTYRYHYEWSDLLFLMEYDRDPFNRWDISQRVAEKVLIDAYGRDLSTWKLPADLLEKYQSILQDTGLSDHVKAEVFRLPSEKYLTQQLAPCDPVRLHQVREAYIAQIAEAFEATWADIYQANATPMTYEYNAEQVGRRAWKNTALTYLIKTNQTLYQEWAEKQFESADNMTDILSAMMLLAEVMSPRFDSVMYQFFERYESEELALHKWFTAQVRSQNVCELEFLNRLLKHQHYDGKNPNCVRAVLGALSYNVECFHDDTGLGYQFLAEQIQLTDGFNPMLAARLCQPLTEWRLYDDRRQVLMRDTLKQLSEGSLSPNLFEVVSKSLS